MMRARCSRFGDQVLGKASSITVSGTVTVKRHRRCLRRSRYRCTRAALELADRLSVTFLSLESTLSRFSKAIDAGDILKVISNTIHNRIFKTCALADDPDARTALLYVGCNWWAPRTLRAWQFATNRLRIGQGRRSVVTGIPQVPSMVERWRPARVLKPADAPGQDQLLGKRRTVGE
jgi:hypothetical protein